ncbi:MAG: NAD(P)-binding oxidoreductase [Cyanobacteria bacterium P01_D01_bin.115]
MNSMKIALLGANGRTGREILTRSLDAGDTVTAIVRTEDKLADIRHPQLRVRAGNVCDANTLKTLLSGHDVVISTLGPRTPMKAACAVYSESATAVVEAMQHSGVNRILVISTALLFPSNRLSHRVLRWIAQHNARNANLMEASLRASKLEWTIARVGFLNNNSSENFQFSVETFPDRGRSISRAAVANFLLTEARECNHPKKVVGLWG